MLPQNFEMREEYGLLDYWSIIRKRWLWMLLPVVLIVPAAWFYHESQPPSFRAQATVILADTAPQAALDPSSQNTGFLSRELENEISLAHGDAVEQRVAEEFGTLPEIVISGDSGADVLSFQALAEDPNVAATVANTWANSYIQVKRDLAVSETRTATESLYRRLERQRTQRQEVRAPLDALDDRIARAVDEETATNLQREYDRLADDLRHELDLLTSQAQTTMANLTELELQAELSAVGEARFLQVAAPPQFSSSPPLFRILALALVLGLIVGFALALLAESRDQTINSASDIESFIGALPVLASIPLASKKQLAGLPTATHVDPEGVFAGGYHRVRTALEFASFDKQIRSVLVTSPNPSEGKSTTAANLALAMGAVGNRTVLVDVDFRRPSVHKFFNIAQAPGVSDISLNGAEMRTVAYSIRDVNLQNFLVMPTGTVPPSPAAFVGAAGFLGTLDRIEAEAEVVVLDAPPLLAVSDAHALGRHADAVLLTARAGSTTKSELAEAIKVLAQVGANVVGCVLIGVEEAESYSRYNYYRSDSNPAAARPPTVAGDGLWGGGRSTETIVLDGQSTLQSEPAQR